MPADAAPVTANRRTRLSLGITETVTGRREWYETRKAADINRDRTNRPPSAPKSENVWFVGGEAWTLAPKGKELAELIRTDVEPPLTSSDVNLAPGFESMMMFRRSDDLPGMNASSSASAAGFNAFVKGVAAGDSWQQYLAADVAAFPQVVTEVEDGDDNYPIDRVLSSTKSFPGNAPFALRYYLPDDFSGTDSFLIFYFGGPADVTPDGEHGGQFALSLRGGGRARLYELDPNQPLPGDRWRRRMEWQYGDPGGFKGRFETIYCIPYGRNRIEFRSAGANYADFGGGGGMIPLLTNTILLGMTLGGRTTHLWKDLPALTGHSHRTQATGAGGVRMDINRSMRIPFSIARLKYPATDNDQNGVVVDAPFAIPWALDENTPIAVHADAYLPDNTSVAVSVYDADTHELLANDADGNWLSVLGQSTYYVKIALASIDGTQTPVLWGYRVAVENAYQTNVRTPNTAANLTSVSVNYACTDPTEEAANLSVSDLLNACPILRQRDGIRSMLQVYNGNNSALVSNLFEGVTTSAQATKKGTQGDVYPSENWHDYDVRMSGIWERLAETFVLTPVNFSRDDAADVDPTTQEQPPWKVTDAIRKLFNLAGFNDDELDIPDLSYRLWPDPTDGSTNDGLVMQTGVDFATAIRRLAWDYLRMVVVRDVNARSGALEGMWRLIRNPTPPYTNIVAEFWYDNPGSLTGKLPHMLGSYPEGTAPIWRDSFRSWVVKPECNEVLVIGVNDKTKDRFWQIATNQDSIDDIGPDALGRHVPCYFPPDSSLTSQGAVDWACRIIYDAAAHAQKWVSFDAPLLFITDPEDELQVRPRRPQVNDLIQVAGLPAVVREVRVDFTRDVNQQMNITALFLNDTTWASAAASSQQTLRKAVAAVVAQSRGEKPSMMAPVFQKQIMNPQAMPHHLTLPVNAGQTKIQAPDGSFYYMMDYDPLDGGAGLN